MRTSKYIIFGISNIFLLLLMLPGIGSQIGRNTLSYGLGLSSLLLLIYGIYHYKLKPLSLLRVGSIKAIILIPFLILIHAILVFYFQGDIVEPIKLALSILLLLLMLIASLSLFYLIDRAGQREFNFTLTYIYYALILIAVAAFFGLLDFGRTGKAVGFASETSQFVLVFSPFIFWKLCRTSNPISRCWIIISLFYSSLLFQSMLLSCIAIIASFITLKINKLPVVFFAMFIVFHLHGMSISYFESSGIKSPFLSKDEDAASKYYRDRLPLLNSGHGFDVSSHNLIDIPRGFLHALVKNSYNTTLLAPISGWERAILNVKDSWGLGFGFNQFGTKGRWGEASLQSYKVTKQSGPGIVICLRSGSLLGAKMVGEFGFIGIFFILIYLKFSLTRLLEFRRYCMCLSQDSSSKNIFYIACVLCFSFSLFLRSPGYFSPESFLFMVSAFGLIMNGKSVSTSPAYQ